MNKSPLAQEIGRRIAWVRRNRAFMSLADFASEMNVATSTVHGWEKGRSHPSAQHVVWICRRYNVSANWLLALTDRR